jgi:hypothetical protein
MKIARWFAWTVALAGTTACGSPGDDGSGGAGGSGGTTTTGPDAAEACAEHSAAVCAKELECFAGREAVIGPLDICSERMTVRCLSRTKQPGTGVTAEALSVCAAAMSAPGCGMFTTVPEECKFTGTRQVGEACADDAQCQSLRCGGASSDGCSACAAPDGSEEPACLGGCDAKPSSCDFEGTVCGYADICNGGLCYPGPKEGEACGSFPYFCTYPAACRTYECVLELPVCPG